MAISSLDDRSLLAVQGTYMYIMQLYIILFHSSIWLSVTYKVIHFHDCYNEKINTVVLTLFYFGRACNIRFIFTE